jgi:hypothetical protein
MLCLWLSISATFASDWEEETPKALPQASHGSGSDAVILDDRQQSGASRPTGGILHGSATAVRSRPAAPSLSYLQARFAERVMAVQRIDAEATRFLQTATVNAVTPPSVFRAFIEKNHPQFALSARNNTESSLLVVRGQWDDSSKPLHALSIKFQMTKTRELSELALDKFKAIVIDCAGEVPQAAIQKVRDFVASGGYLLTTDWALQNVLERAFPGFVKWNGDNTDGVITDAYIVDPDSPLMAGLSGRRFTWKLDRMSQCVRILAPERVQLIARSSRLSQQDPQLRVLSDPLLAGALAVEFSFGRGKVLHLAGHFDNCSNSFRPLLLPDPAPGAGISLRQALAANFLVEALSKTGKSPTGKSPTGKSPASEGADQTAPPPQN